MIAKGFANGDKHHLKQFRNLNYTSKSKALGTNCFVTITEDTYVDYMLSKAKINPKRATRYGVHTTALSYIIKNIKHFLSLRIHIWPATTCSLKASKCNKTFEALNYFHRYNEKVQIFRERSFFTWKRQAQNFLRPKLYQK